MHPGRKHAEKLTDRYKLDSLTLLLENLEKRNDLKRGTALRGNEFQRRLLVLLLLLAAGCLLAKPITVQLNSGQRFDGDLLWATDSTLYMWQGFGRFKASEIRENVQAWQLDEIRAIGFVSPYTINQAIYTTLKISIPFACLLASGAEDTADFLFSFTLGNVFVGVVAAEIYAVYRALSRRTTNILDWPAEKLHKKLRKKCRLKPHKHQREIALCQEIVQP